MTNPASGIGHIRILDAITFLVLEGLHENFGLGADADLDIEVAEQFRVVAAIGVMDGPTARSTNSRPAGCR